MSWLGAADRWPLTMAHVNMCAPGSSRKWQHPLHECWGVIWITQGSPKRQRLFDCVCLRTPCVQRRHLVTLGQHLAPFRYLFANADLLPQYLSRKGGPPEHPIQAAIPILAKRCALYTYKYLCLGDHRDCKCTRKDAKCDACI